MKNDSAIPVVHMDNKLTESLDRKLGPMLLYSSYGNVQSRYLREPVGSCHDLCKHGLKYESIDDRKHSIFRRLVVNSFASNDVRSSVKSWDIENARKESRIKTKARGKASVLDDTIQHDKQEAGLFEKSVSSNVVTSFINGGAVNSSQIMVLNERSTISLSKDNDFPENLGIPTCASKELVEAANIAISTTQKLQEQLGDDEMAKLVFDNKKNIGLASPKLQNKSFEISPLLTLSESPVKESNLVDILNSSKKIEKQVNKQEVSSMPKLSQVKRNILKPKLSSILPAFRADANAPKRKFVLNSMEPVTSEIQGIKQKNTVLKQESASSQIQRSSQNALIPSRKIANSAKPKISLRSRTPLVRSLSRISASRSLNIRRKLEEMANRNNEKLNVGKIFTKSPEESFSSTSSQSVITMKDGKCTYVESATCRNIGKSNVNLVGIHGKELEITKEKPSKCQNVRQQKSFNNIGNVDACKSTASDGSELSENERELSKQRHMTVKGEDKRLTKRTPAFQSNDNSSSPYKLRFKRGKVIELRATDAVGPKRLRFRRGRVLGENSSCEAIQRSFRRRKDIVNSSDPSSDAHAVLLKQANFEAKVTLKHQDAQEKKDMQALLNHVIEETASKLVATRKSKVKALVGAFETVISLQETKPAAAV